MEAATPPAGAMNDCRLYGADDSILEGGLHSFFLLLDEPEVYNLPRNPARPANNVVPASLSLDDCSCSDHGIAGHFLFQQESLTVTTKAKRETTSVLKLTWFCTISR